VKADIYKILFGIVLGLGIMYLLRDCGGSTTDPIIGTTIETVHHTDTVYKHHTDTVFVEGPYRFIYKDIPDNIVEEEDETYYVHEWNRPDLNLKVTTSAKGSQSINYSVICPVITNTDSIIVTNTDTVTITNNINKRANKFFVGGEIGMSNKEVSGVGLNFTWQMKNDLQVYYEYGAMFNSNDQHRFGVKVPIKRRKK
jgi:hypothetical protein